MMNLMDKAPSAAKTAYVAPTAEVIGNVALAENSSVWPSCVLRGDAGTITIGENTNIQDRTIVSGGDVSVGDNVTVGHGAVIAGSVEVQSESFVGMGAILGEGAVSYPTPRKLIAIPTEEFVTFPFVRMLVRFCCFFLSSFLYTQVVESGAMVAAGAVVRPGTVIPAGEVWAGNPAKKMRDMSAAEKAQVTTSAKHYVELAAQYM